MVAHRALVNAFVAIAAVLLGVTFGAPAARADDARSVQVVDQTGRTVTFMVYLDPSVPLEAGSTVTSSVIVSGVEVPSEPTKIADAAASKEAVLALDVSGSMRGSRLTAAKEAAVNYVNSLPADVEIGLLSFNNVVTVDVQPTTDKEAVIAAIEGLEAGRKTALYDAIISGLGVADPAKGARLLVLSDGGDSASTSTLDQVNAAASAKGVPVDIVALTPSPSHEVLLQQIADESGGQVLLAQDATGLKAAFEQATGSLGGKVKVVSEIPQNVDASNRFAVVAVGVDGTDYRGTAQMPETDALAGNGTSPITFPAAGDSPATTPLTTQTSTDAWIYALLIALIVIVGALAIASFRRQQRARLRVEQVLWYSTAITSGEYGKRPELGDSSLLAGLDKWMSTQGWYATTDSRLDNAGVRISVATWLAIRVVAALVLSVIIGLLLGNVWIGLAIGIILGWFVSGVWLSSRESARRRQFETELPDFLMLMASSLRAGLSVQQALDSAASEGTGEVSRQIRRAMSEVQMGSTVEDSLLRVSDRMQNDDLKWTVTALAIQREVGGNLSNILDTAAATVKSRFELRREVRTLSAEGRLSGWVLAALPIGLFAYMLVANRDYVSFFWTTTIGVVSLIVICVLFIVGFIWMRRIARIEV